VNVDVRKTNLFRKTADWNRHCINTEMNLRATRQSNRRTNMEPTMKSLPSPGNAAIQPTRVPQISRQCVMIFGFLVASSLSTSLRAQENASPGFLSIPTQNQNVEAYNNAAVGALSATDVAALPDAPAPSAPGGANISRQPDFPAGNDPVNTEVITPTTLTFDRRLNLYLHSYVTPQSLVGPLLGAGIAQAEGTPHEWGGGMEGFGRRFASSYARSVIGRTVEFGVAAVDHEDPRYHPSDQTGVWRRTRHAIAATFVSQTTSGGSMPAFSRIAGAYSAGFIANAWEPPSQNSAEHAFERGSTSLLSSIGWHVVEEFWPDIRSAMRHHHD
jgi:hypothetical protein